MRVTAGEVQLIFDTNMDSDLLQTFIRAAHALVNNVILPKGGIDDDTLKEIERWLAAHFACIRDPIALRSKIGDSEQWSFPASVTTAWGFGLKLTAYGQQALVLDTTGTLANLGKPKGSYRAAPREDSDHYTRRITKA